MPAGSYALGCRRWCRFRGVTFGADSSFCAAWSLACVQSLHRRPGSQKSIAKADDGSPGRAISPAMQLRSFTSGLPQFGQGGLSFRGPPTG